MYSEIALTMGYYLLKNTFIGAAEFVKSHQLNAPQLNTCPSEFQDLPVVGEGVSVCTLGEMLKQVLGLMNDSLQLVDESLKDVEALKVRCICIGVL